MIEPLPSEARTILVVDDNEADAAYLADLLQGEHHSTIVCHTGQKALELVKNRTPDLVLLNAMLPDIEGHEVARRAKMIAGPEQFIPVIMVSAPSGNHDQTDDLAYADDFITRPFSDKGLIARISALFRIQKLQRELSASRRRYQFLYEHAPHLYISIDRNHLVSNCNTAFCAIFGRTKDSVLGSRLADYFSTGDVPSLERFLGSLSGIGPTPTEPVFELAIPGDKNHQPMLVALNAVYVGENEPGVWVMIAMQDVTVRSRLEEEHRLARKQLYRSASLASIGTLASGVAHEINNPLTAILGFSSSLIERFRRKEDVPNDELLEYLSIINAESIRCRDIVENLTKFAQERDSQIRDISLQDSLAAAIRLMQARAIKKNISIINLIEHDELLRADLNKLSQVFVNLFANAIDFCANGSSIRVSSSPSASRNGYLRIMVTDNGPGIPAQVLPKIFDPFFTTKPVGTGTGLGLSLCHRIIEEFTGSIDIVSEPGSGTTVVIELPRSQLG